MTASRSRGRGAPRWIARLGAGARRRAGHVAWRVGSVLDRLALQRALPPRVGDSVRRSSRYVEVRDGTRIAVDLYRPARGGAVVDEPFPVVWTQERYHRARFEGGHMVTRLDREPWLKLLARLGYVVCVADLRGSGASFGHRDRLVVEADRWDAHDLTEWLAARPWSTGRVGMFGKSFMGLTQFLAASTAPPSLRAIHPEKTLFDLYAFAHPGGVFRDDYGRAWGANIADLDQVRPAAPVDEDPDGTLLAQAMEEHRANRDVFSTFAGLPYRDSRDGGGFPYSEESPSTYVEEVARSGVAVFQLAGWRDMWPRDALLWHRNLPNPRKLVIGPWSHTSDDGWRLFMDRLRWYDHWLKGKDNGVMDEAPIRFATEDGRGRSVWRSAWRWPLPEAEPRALHLDAGGHGDAREHRDGGRHLDMGAPPEPDGAEGPGRLAWEPPRGPPRTDAWRVDYAATTGLASRWRNGYGLELAYPDMAPHDARGRAYTTAPLDAPLEVTGHPVAHLWVSCDADDLDLFVYLREVRPGGRSLYVTEGVLRASHRARSAPAHDNLGLPWHAGTADAVARLPREEPVELVLDLHPVSRVFDAGSRIRLTLAGADADNLHTPAVEPPPEVRVHLGEGFPSRLVLPAVEREGP